MDEKPAREETKETYQITTRNHSRSILHRAAKSIRRTYHFKTSTPQKLSPSTEESDIAERSTDSSFTCDICSQVLPSSPELNKHISNHSFDKISCPVCSVVFKSADKMHRHVRLHHEAQDTPGTSPITYESDGSTDSNNSSEYIQQKHTRKSMRKRRLENNNNYSPNSEQNNNKRKVECFNSDGIDLEQNLEIQYHAKKRSKHLNNNNNNNIEEIQLQKYHCPVCDREDFASLNVFETHLEDQHPEFEIKCSICNVGFKNHRVLNLHRFMVHQESPPGISGSHHKSVEAPIRGFKDLTFVDFSSEKFPHIARAACEKEIRESAQNDGVRFHCDLCKRAFPCASSLEIHAKDCGRESEKRNFTFSANPDEAKPLDLGKKANENCIKEECDDSCDDETHRRDSFFAKLDLRNTSSASENSEDDTGTVKRVSQNVPTLKLKEYLSVKPEFGSLLTNKPQSVDSTKDLADIQSIISVTAAGGLLQQLASKNIQKTQELQESSESNPDQKITNFNQDSNSNHQSGAPQGEEEYQDDFAAEFRKMKLRGEFPCRLCTAVFPNLRALKGHNRAHLTGSGNSGPYRCNMCPHSSTDKAALVRHMRSHNGDRPYECSICNYAFTTKANCERHLRNRHAKVTREDVKRSIIYHPSEDPTNEEIASKIYGSQSRSFSEEKSFGIKEESRPMMFTSTPDGTPKIPITLLTPTQIPQKPQIGNYIPTSSSIPNGPRLQIPDLTELRKFIGVPAIEPVNIPASIIPKPISNIVNFNEINLANATKDLVALKEHRIPPKATYSEALNLSNVKESETPIPKIHVRNFEDLKRNSIENTSEDDARNSESEDEGRHKIIETPLTHYRDEYYNRKNSETAPIDLSMDVLDLSKKKRSPSPVYSDEEKEEPVNEQEQPKDFSKKTLEFSSVNNTSTPGLMFERTQQFLLAQQFLKGTNASIPNISTEFYANQIQNMYRNSLASTSFSGFSLNPYYPSPANPFLTPTPSPREMQEIKERLQKEIIRGLQLSGGSLIMDQLAQDRYPQFSGFPTPNDTKNDLKPLEEMKPLQIDTNSSFMEHKMGSPSKTPSKTESIISTTPNSVKMVIKNGVLMPKQKQRRYRTERPFSCEHCSARFTLRSNMERHIKQQHPQFWSQRQRSNMAGVPGRKPTVQIPQKNFFEHHSSLNVPQYETIAKGYEYLSKNNELSEKRQGDVLDFSGDKMNFERQPAAISEQVKYAILAQQLKQVMKKDESNKINVEASKMDEDVDEAEENDALVIDEGSQSQESKSVDESNDIKKVSIEENLMKLKLIQKKLMEHDRDTEIAEKIKEEDGKSGSVEEKKKTGNEDDVQDLVPVSRLLDNASQIPFSEYFRRSGAAEGEEDITHSEEDEEGLVSASGSASESGGNASGSDGNRSESETALKQRPPEANSKSTSSQSNATAPPTQKKKSAYSLAPNRVTCPYCHRKFPWSSSLRRHVLTHTGQKPYKCPYCPLLFTTKSNCDRHLLRKHGNAKSTPQNTENKPEPTIQAPKSVTLASTQLSRSQNVSDISTNFLMRNVPERPFKCSSCPSSTFSTLNNLKKHISFKHSGQSNPGSPRSGDDAVQRPGSSQYGYESHSSEDERYGNRRKNSSDWESNPNYQAEASSYNATGPSNSELPFKCHLCDGSYAERQETLDHIKEYHGAEYELLVSKGALETSAVATHQPIPEAESKNHDHEIDLSNKSLDLSRLGKLDGTSSDQDDQNSVNAAALRGKFPDYANRKVICAFCMRRFWSAEDLRRHMRTHNGARPFSCDVCRRRFTLKHSMLRHRKKHNVQQVCGTVSDVDFTEKQAEIEKEQSGAETSTEPEKDECGAERKEDGENGSDLIGNLLGIRDRSIIDQVLVSSADDAAKLLGVEKAE